MSQLERRRSGEVVPPLPRLKHDELLVTGRTPAAVESGLDQLRRDQRLVAAGRRVFRDGEWTAIAKVLPLPEPEEVKGRHGWHPGWIVAILLSAAALVVSVAVAVSMVLSAIAAAATLIAGVAVVIGLIVVVVKTSGGDRFSQTMNIFRR